MFTRLIVMSECIASDPLKIDPKTLENMHILPRILSVYFLNHAVYEIGKDPMHITRAEEK